MKRIALATLVVASLLSFGSLASAQEKKAKNDPATAMVTQFVKQLEKAELTEEQIGKIKEVYAKAAKEVAKARTDGGITAEMLKKRIEAGKAAKEAGKKGKEIQEAVAAEMGLNDEQKKLWTETEAVLEKARIEIGKLLTPEQMEKLPAQAQAQLKAKEGGKKGKAK